MKAPLLMLTTAALLLASVAQASPAQDRFVDETRAQAHSRLVERGVDLSGRTLVLRFAFGAERLASVGVARTSGSPELDAQAVAALRNLKTARPPTEVVGRTVVVTLGDSAPQAAAN